MIPGGRVSPPGNQDLQPPEICRSYKHNHLLPSFPLPLDSWTHEFYLLGIQPFIMVIILGCILDPRRWHLSFVILLFNHAGEFWVEWYRIMVMCPQHASLAVKWISWSLVLLCRILCWQMKHSGSPWTVVLGRKWKPVTCVHSSQEEALTLAEWEESSVTILPAIDWLIPLYGEFSIAPVDSPLDIQQWR